MKNKLNIIAVILILGGLVVFLTGFTQAGFDIAKLDSNGEPIEKSYTASGNNLDIYTELKNIKVIVRQSKDSDIHITYYENNNTHYEIIETNNSLTIKKIDDILNNFRFFSFEINSLNVSIDIPYGYDGDIEINTTNAKVEVDNLTIGGESVINTTNGKIIVTNVQGNMIDLNTTNGKIIVDNVQGNTIDLSTTNGRIELDTVDVTLKLSCKSTNASITGTVCGDIDDFSITSRTTNDRNNLPNNTVSKDKSFSAITTNGRIKIQFTD